MCVFLAFISAAPYVIAASGRPPSEYGLYFLLMAVGYAAGNFVTSKTTERVDPDRLIVIGLSISASGTILMLLLALAGYTHPLALFAPAMFLSLGQGIASPNIQTGAVKQAPDLAGTASGVASFVQNLFGAAVIQAIVLLPNQDGVGLSAVLTTLSLCGLAAVFWTLRRSRALGVTH
jgi:DHA1 family bicyclomycin/chloramphenicol resistance-like MFS transporter